MLFSFTARIISALAAFIYPGYASYKTLSQRPASEDELERWLMYWSVLGCIVGVEYIAEWLISWIPFYAPLKALFLLYLALPQTQGSTYIYLVHLRPFLAAHERQIDNTLAEVRARVYRLAQEKAQALWAALVASLAPGGAASANAASAGGIQTPPAEHQRQGQGQPQQPPAGPTQLLSSLWTSYGPGILAGGTALLRQTAAATLPGSSSASASVHPASSASLSSNNNSAFFASTNPHARVPVDPAARRRQLEAELAALSAPASIPMPTPMPYASTSFSSSSSSHSPSSSPGGGLRDRTNSSGRFEEIRGGDVEGYDEVSTGSIEGEGEGEVRGSAKNASWFGWGAGAGGGSGGYERVKSD